MPKPPSVEDRQRDLEEREPSLPPELVALLVRLHELRLDAGTTLEKIADATANLDSGSRKWRASRVDEQLTAKPRPVLPDPALRAALIELYCTPARPRRARANLTRQIDKMANAADRALHPETPGNAPTSIFAAWHRWSRRRRVVAVLAVSVLAMAVFVAAVPVGTGAAARHARFEQCIAANALTADADSGPARTVLELLVPDPPPERTRYTVHDQSGALQATVVFTTSAQVARTVLDENRDFYAAHRIFDNDYTVNDTTVITPQTAKSGAVSGVCANGA